jgi:hypothetical protein
MVNPYEDIINLPHHTSASRPRMSVHDRAAQFSPFAALTGYDAAITETARLTDKKIELDEYEKAELSERLCMIQDLKGQRPEVSITYFVPDKKKSGGEYITVTGYVRKIDEHERTVVMQDAAKIPIDDILEIDGELFRTFEALMIKTE